MSLELNDFLITVRSRLDLNFQGFNKCIDTYRLNPYKIDLFISQCQYLIKNGWDDNFEETYFSKNLSNNQDYDEEGYLSDILKPFLVNPAKNAFRHKNISENEEKLVLLFIRLALLKLIFDAHKNDPCVKNAKSWFGEMKNQLEQEFDSLSELSYNLNMTYNGQPVKSIEEINRAIKITNNSYLYLDANSNRNSLKIKACGVFIGFVLVMDKYLNASSDKNTWQPSFVSMMLIGAAALFVIYIISQQVYNIAKNNMDYFFLHSGKENSKNKINSDFFTNVQIQKFFFITDQEIQEMEDISSNNLGLRQRRVI